MAAIAKTITIAELREMPRNNGMRCSMFCPNCFEMKGESNGCFAHTTTHSFTWWKCRNCKHRYDLTVCVMAVKYQDGFGLDESRKGKKKAA